MKIIAIHAIVLLTASTPVTLAQSAEPRGNCTDFTQQGDYTYLRYAQSPERISGASYCPSRDNSTQGCALVADGDLQVTFSVNTTTLRDTYWNTQEGPESFLHMLIRTKLGDQGADFNQSLTGVIDTVVPLEPGIGGYLNFYPLLRCVQGTMTNCTGGPRDGLGIEACAPVASVDGSLKIVEGRAAVQNVSAQDVNNYPDPFANQARGGGVNSVVLSWQLFVVTLLGVIGATSL